MAGGNTRNTRNGGTTYPPNMEAIIAQRVADAIAAYEANRASTSNGGGTSQTAGGEVTHPEDALTKNSSHANRALSKELKEQSDYFGGSKSSNQFSVSVTVMLPTELNSPPVHCKTVRSPGGTHMRSLLELTSHTNYHGKT